MDGTFYRHAHEFLQRGLDLLFPPRCAGCQRCGHLLCSSCLRTMQPFSTPLCRRCGMPLASVAASCAACRRDHFRLDGLRFVNLYQGALREAIHALKYVGQKRLAEPLGLLLAQAFSAYGMSIDGLVPLPLHSQRQQQRGYNQSALLARVCARHLKLPCLEDLVIRQRATRTQVGLNVQERLQNVSGAFALAPNVNPCSLTWRRLLLIDDVCTTGASLEACAAPLYAAGVQEVWGLVLGRPGNQTAK